MGVAVESTEYPLEWTLAGRRKPELLRELIELRGIAKIGRQIGRCRIDPKAPGEWGNRDRPGQRRCVAADEDVAMQVAADRGELGRAEIVAHRQVVEC